MKIKNILLNEYADEPTEFLWISPKGSVYPLHVYEHAEAATQILINMGYENIDDIDPVEKLEKLGWLHITDGDIADSYRNKKITQKMIDGVFDYGIESYGKNIHGWPSWFKEIFETMQKQNINESVLSESIMSGELLPIGTEVNVNGKRGEVVKAEMKKDQFGAPICLHTIHFTKQYAGRTGGKEHWKNIDKIQKVNYASIEVIKKV